MTIRISRNAAGNCINFVGSSMPAYYNACLSGAVDGNDNTLVNVINDIHTANNPNGEIRYEFYQIPYTELSRVLNRFESVHAIVRMASGQVRKISANT